MITAQSRPLHPSANRFARPRPLCPWKELLLSAAALWPGLATARALDFNRDVRPILSDKCFFCHGFDAHERKADLRLDTAEGAAETLAAEDGQQSEFLYRILSDDEDDLMPPPESHKTLSPKESKILQQWVAEGAHYDAPWAYVPPVKTEQPPAVQNTTWPANRVDHHILARLEAEGLKPSPDADPVTLVRRLHFDLIGLPPEPAVVEAFVVAFTQDSNTAVGDLVDELLASPHFGERMAIYWLDLVRFADTVGYHGDQVHHITPYRDYVIAAFNQNLPFDRFTREQLAGDLLPKPTLDQKIASGYNRLLQTSHEGGIQKKEYNAIYAADRVRNLSAVWMGATVGCAQCHDHKYDPYSIKDHYALASFFADIHDAGFTGNSTPTKRPPEIALYSNQQEQRLAEIDKQLARLAEAEKAAKAVAELEKKIVSTPESPEKTALETQLVQLDTTKTPEAAETAETAELPQAKRKKALKSERARIERSVPRTMITVAKAPRVMRVLTRGDWQDDSGEVVEPAVPAFLPQIATDDEGKQGAEPTGQPRRATRLDLANWLCNAEQGVGGLTARVMANRFWYLYFWHRDLAFTHRLRRAGRSSCQPDPARRPRCRISRVRVGCENACPSPRHLTGLPAVVNHQSRNAGARPAQPNRRPPIPLPSPCRDHP